MDPGTGRGSHSGPGPDAIDQPATSMLGNSRRQVAVISGPDPKASPAVLPRPAGDLQLKIVWSAATDDRYFCLIHRTVGFDSRSGWSPTMAAGDPVRSDRRP